MNYLSYFFDPVHLFALRPAAMNLRGVYIIVGVAVLLIIVGIALRFFQRATKDGLKVKAYRKFAACFITMGALGLVYAFFAYEGAILLSSRFWILVLGLVFAVWIGSIVRYWMTVLPRMRSTINEERQMKKYIP